jgi:hypothetical protein
LIHKPILISFLLFIALTGYYTKAEETKMAGDDKYNHGCIPSAGYQWCGKENKCVRSWELAKVKGITNTKEAFATYCQQ